MKERSLLYFRLMAFIEGKLLKSPHIGWEECVGTVRLNIGLKKSTDVEAELIEEEVYNAKLL